MDEGVTGPDRTGPAVDADPTRDGAEDGTGDAETTDGEPTERAGWSAGKVAVLVLACAFLAGALGYLLGDRTSGPPDSAVDTGFLQDMITHHDQAVSMASVTTANASDPIVRDMAREVLIEQRYELGRMDAYLQERGKERGADEREVMGWMGRPLPVAEMPGYATPEQLDALQSASPDEQNELFLELMIAHHQGGVDMAEYAARHAEDPQVRHLAEVMASVQTQEIREYQLKLADLQAG